MVSKRLSAQQIILIVGLFSAGGCATVHLPNVGESGYRLEDDEKRLFKRSGEFIEAIDESDLLYQNEALNVYLNQMAQQLLSDSVKEDGIEISIRVIKDPALNAFSLPNGRIYIHTGMLAAMDNEAQLATVLGHEMTHVINRHGVKSFRSLVKKSAFLATVSMPVSALSGGLGGIVTQLATISSIYGYSQDLEYEADEGGFNLTAKQKFSLQEAVNLFEHLKEFTKDEEIKEPFFFSTHPRIVERIKNYEELLNAHPQESIENKRVDSAEFEGFLNTILLDNIGLCFENGFFKTAERNVFKYIARNPGDPQGYYLRGELAFKRLDPPKGVKKRSKSPDYEAALKDYQKAISLNDSFAKAYLGQAKIYQKNKKDLEAKEAYKKYLALEGDAPERAYIEKYLQDTP